MVPQLQALLPQTVQGEEDHTKLTLQCLEAEMEYLTTCRQMIRDYSLITLSEKWQLGIMTDILTNQSYLVYNHPHILFA